MILTAKHQALLDYLHVSEYLLKITSNGCIFYRLVPSAPSQIQIKGTQYRKRRISWQMPDCEVSNCSYKVEVIINEYDKVYIEEMEQCEFMLKKFRQGFEYSIRVAAVNSAGQGRFSQTFHYCESKLIIVCLLVN